VVIGLAAFSVVLVFIVVALVVSICKMRITDRKAIKKDFNPLYGMDYEAEEAGSAREEAENKEDPPRPKSVDNQYDYINN